MLFPMTIIHNYRKPLRRNFRKHGIFSQEADRVTENAGKPREDVPVPLAQLTILYILLLWGWL
jgi:hypothetical protein